MENSDAKYRCESPITVDAPLLARDLLLFLKALTTRAVPVQGTKEPCSVLNGAHRIAVY